MKEFFPPHRPHRRRVLSDEEIALWLDVTRDVARKPGVAALPAPPPSAEQKTVTPGSTAPGFSPAPLRASPPPLTRLERRLKQNLLRGRTQVDGVIDLHGMRQHEAHRALVRFLHDVQARHGRVVLVVTGKGGRMSQFLDDPMREAGVLRRLTPQWLSAPELRATVAGFEEAAQPHGGSGALYVRLRRSRLEGAR